MALHFTSWQIEAPDNTVKVRAAREFICRFPAKRFYRRQTKVSTPIAARVDTSDGRLSFVFGREAALFLHFLRLVVTTDFSIELIARIEDATTEARM